MTSAVRAVEADEARRFQFEPGFSVVRAAQWGYVTRSSGKTGTEVGPADQVCRG
jgi:hypothetical protein